MMEPGQLLERPQHNAHYYLTEAPPTLQAFPAGEERACLKAKRESYTQLRPTAMGTLPARPCPSL